MIQGIVTPDREAIIRFRILDISGQAGEIEATIDTGFNHYLTLPPALILLLGLERIGTTEATLGDGSAVTMDYYSATILWNNQPRQIPVLEAEGGALVGMALLYGSRLTINVIDGGIVTIKALPEA